MDELFAPGVKAWRAHDLVMGSVINRRADLDAELAGGPRAGSGRESSAGSISKANDEKIERA